MTIEQLKQEYINAYTMNIKPPTPKLDLGFITDPDMSVNWNIQQVKENNEQYRKELEQLREERDKVISNVERQVLAFISTELNIIEECAKDVWLFVLFKCKRKDDYCTSYNETFDILSNTINLIKNLKYKD